MVGKKGHRYSGRVLSAGTQFWRGGDARDT